MSPDPVLCPIAPELVTLLRRPGGYASHWPVRMWLDPHNVLTVEESAEARRALIEVLVYHQRTDDTGCACGWNVLGASFATHIADVYEQTLTFDT